MIISKENKKHTKNIGQLNRSTRNKLSNKNKSYYLQTHIHTHPYTFTVLMSTTSLHICKLVPVCLFRCFQLVGLNITRVINFFGLKEEREREKSNKL